MVDDDVWVPEWLAEVVLKQVVSSDGHRWSSGTGRPGQLVIAIDAKRRTANRVSRHGVRWANELRDWAFLDGAVTRAAIYTPLARATSIVVTFIERSTRGAGWTRYSFPTALLRAVKSRAVGFRVMQKAVTTRLRHALCRHK